MARPTKPGNLERGWNDPPVFLYNTGSPMDPAASTTTPKRHPLTKRIAYTDGPPSDSVASVGAEGGSKEPSGLPTDSDIVSDSRLISSSTTASTDLLEDNFPQVQLFPPSNTTELPRFAAPIIVPTMIHGSSVDGVIRPVPVIATNPVSGAHVAANETTDILQIPNFDDDEQMFHYVITRLHRAIRDCQTVVEPRVLEDIQKKVNILSDLWKNGKVSYPVKCTMARLSTAVHKRQCTIAQELHLALMIDHVSEVSKWLVGIKRLIQEVERVEQPLSPSSVCFPTNDGMPFQTPVTQPTESADVQPAEAVQSEAELANRGADDKSPDDKSPDDKSPAESHDLLMSNATQLPIELREMNHLVDEQVELAAAANKTECDGSVISSLEGLNVGSVVKSSENLSKDPTVSEESVG